MEKANERDLKKVNVAVVGLGFMGVMHIRAYLEHGMASSPQPVRLCTRLSWTLR